ncbi:MAG: hypothetical protein P8Y47_04760 [Alphaproteobacteria bacterium]
MNNNVGMYMRHTASIFAKTAKIAVMAALAATLFNGGKVNAEPVTGRVLSHYQIKSKNGCMILKINLNIRVRLVSYFPVNRGDQLNIVLRPIDPGIAAAEAITPRESLRPPENGATAIQAIMYEERGAQGPELSLQFRRPVNFDVALGQDFQSLLISMTDGRKRKACPAFDPFKKGSWETTIRSQRGETIASKRKKNKRASSKRETATSRRTAIPASPTASGWATQSEDAPLGSGTASGIRQARAAMKRKDMPTAIAMLKGLDGPVALELLGVAYQKNRQYAEAKATYEDYLRLYKNTYGAKAVRQRLASLETAHGATARKLRGRSRKRRDGPGTSYWTLSGSMSEFYIRDDSFRVTRDPTQPLDFNKDDDDHRVHRNVMLSGVDALAVWGNNHYKSKFRFSGTQEHGFNEDGEDIVSVASMYYDFTARDWETTARIGRQTRSGNGVLGRYDGLFASWQAFPGVRIQAVGGSPVARRSDEPFKDDKYFYGASVNFGQVLGGFDASLFAIEQRDRDIIDRRAVGAELRYVDPTKSAFLTTDYDVYHDQLNAVIFNGSLTLPNKSKLRASADYRKAPYLSTWTAINGQPQKTLYELLKEHTLAEAEQMAVDRTATYKSASVGYTHQFSDKLQLNLDFTAANIEGTIASYGVEAIPSTGTEFYYSAQLVGNNLLTDKDLWIASARYSDSDSLESYAVDFSTRYQISEDMRISPRLLATYREGKTFEMEEYSLLPSFLLAYFVTKDLDFELEVGTRMSWRNQAEVETRDTEVFITAGLRYDFYTGSDRLK